MSSVLNMNYLIIHLITPGQSSSSSAASCGSGLRRQGAPWWRCVIWNVTTCFGVDVAPETELSVLSSKRSRGKPRPHPGLRTLPPSSILSILHPLLRLHPPMLHTDRQADRQTDRCTAFVSSLVNDMYIFFDRILSEDVCACDYVRVCVTRDDDVTIDAVFMFWFLLYRSDADWLSRAHCSSLALSVKLWLITDWSSRSHRLHLWSLCGL